MNFSPRSVLVGMSGGVDSSLTAALLKRRGFRVVGGFIKNWSDSKDLWTGECAWRGERRDALRVAAHLGIPLLTFDFEKLYRERVVEALFKGYGAGETPNPDVLCNEAIKFGVFFEAAREQGFDAIATGHYARVRHAKDGSARLFRGVDPDKDQSYFLYRVSQTALRRTLFPIGHLHKSKVRQLARELKLPVANKPDSQGICFIGKLDMAEFLRKKIPSRPGNILDIDGNVIGKHDGLDAYTIGQRHGIGLATGGQAWYVAEKRDTQNELLVVPGANHPALCADTATIRDLHWTRGQPIDLPQRLSVQVRYHQQPVRTVVSAGGSKSVLRLAFAKPVKAVAAGQSAVLYRGNECLGGGVITKNQP